jgi:hypothetical protein
MQVSLLLFTLVLSADPSADGGIAPSLQPIPWPEKAAVAAPAAAPPPVFDAGVHAAVPVEGEAAQDAAPENDGKVKLRAAAEGSLTSFPSGTPGGQQDVFFDLRPIVGIDVGDSFGIEVGAEFRLRLIDETPGQRADDIGGVLRGADWDEASDFGQILRSLRISKPDSVFWIQAGAVRKKTLGLGHLISRYSNQDNPDYHPAGATVGVNYKAIRAELFASDIFGARIFAGEVVADVGRIFANSEGFYDRFHLAFSAAHDAGRAGYVAPAVTLFQLDFDAVLYRNTTTRIMVLAGLGARTADVLDPTPDLGLLAGLSIDAMLEGGFSIGGRLEIRKQQGGFRPGFIGAGYEIARFAGTGFSGPSRAAEQLADGFSFAAELHIASGTAVSFDLAAEYFNWGRTDLDALFSLEIIDHRLVAGARFMATGLGKIPRYAMTSELRLRLFSSFYVMGAAGTVFFPQPDGTLVRGIFAGAGAGIDFER